MAVQKLKLVKNNGHVKRAGQAGKRPYQTPRLIFCPPHARRLASQIVQTKSLTLTPAEAAEAARFRALTAARSARQTMLRQIMAELQELDSAFPAA